MTWIRQADVGRCDFIDVLEEAVVRRGEVTLELADGSQVTDRVVNVETRDGDDFALLAGGRRLAVGTIAAMTRA